MKKHEVRAMYKAMQEIKDLKCSAKFAYGIPKNKAIINSETKAIIGMEKPIAEFEKKRLALCNEYAEKDENGKPIKEIKNIGGYKHEVFKGVEDNEEFSVKLITLKENYQPKFDEIDKILNEEIEFEFHMISLGSVPDDITPAQIEALMPLINED